MRASAARDIGAGVGWNADAAGDLGELRGRHPLLLLDRHRDQPPGEPGEIAQEALLVLVGEHAAHDA